MLWFQYFWFPAVPNVSIIWRKVVREAAGLLPVSKTSLPHLRRWVGKMAREGLVCSWISVKTEQPTSFFFRGCSKWNTQRHLCCFWLSHWIQPEGSMWQLMWSQWPAHSRQWAHIFGSSLAFPLPVSCFNLSLRLASSRKVYGPDGHSTPHTCQVPSKTLKHTLLKPKPCGAHGWGSLSIPFLAGKWLKPPWLSLSSKGQRFKQLLNWEGRGCKDKEGNSQECSAALGQGPGSTSRDTFKL